MPAPASAGISVLPPSTIDPNSGSWSNETDTQVLWDILRANEDNTATINDLMQQDFEIASNVYDQRNDISDRINRNLDIISQRIKANGDDIVDAINGIDAGGGSGGLLDATFTAANTVSDTSLIDNIDSVVPDFDDLLDGVNDSTGKLQSGKRCNEDQCKITNNFWLTDYNEAQCKIAPRVKPKTQKRKRNVHYISN